jgi:hypothetical protein
MNLKNASRVMVTLYNEHVTSDTILEVLTKKKSIKRYAFIMHDKDKVKDHFHLLLDFGRSHDIERIKAWFPDHPGMDQLVEPLRSWTASVQYLIHMNDKDKYQYDRSQILANYDISDDLAQVPVTKIPAWFGNFDEVDYYNQITWLASNLSFEKRVSNYRNLQAAYKLYIETNNKQERSIMVWFITGQTGSGKSTLARHLAKRQGKSYYITGSGNDPFDGYAGQSVVIMDDLGDQVFSFLDLLKILDNYAGSMIKSRFYNKQFQGTDIIITTTVPLVNWYKEDPTVKVSDLPQLYRRINMYVELLGHPDTADTAPQRTLTYWGVDKTGFPNDQFMEDNPFHLSKLIDKVDPVDRDERVQVALSALRDLKNE